MEWAWGPSWRRATGPLPWCCTTLTGGPRVPSGSTGREATCPLA